MKTLSINREDLPQHIKENYSLIDPIKNIAEIGSFEGTYALSILSSFPNAKISLIDMWETSGNDFYYSIRPGTVESAYQVALKRFESFDNVKLLKGSSLEISKSFEDSSLDFIYIDADHSYEGCLQDLQLWYPKVRTGGIISGHDWDCNPSMQEYSKFGVEKAVREFFDQRLDEITLTSEQYHKSWMLVS